MQSSGILHPEVSPHLCHPVWGLPFSDLRTCLQNEGLELSVSTENRLNGRRLFFLGPKAHPSISPPAWTWVPECGQWQSLLGLIMVSAEMGALWRTALARPEVQLLSFSFGFLSQLPFLPALPSDKSHRACQRKVSWPMPWWEEHDRVAWGFHSSWTYF